MKALLIKVGFCDVLVWSLNTNDQEEGGISWPLVEESEINPISCFPTHTYSKNSLYLCI